MWKTQISQILKLLPNSAFSWKFEKRKKPPKPVREFYIFGTTRVRSEHVSGYTTAERRCHLPIGAEERCKGARIDSQKEIYVTKQIRNEHTV